MILKMLWRKGIVTNLSCSNEKCNTHVEVYHYLDSDNEKDIKEAILKEIDWGGGRGVDTRSCKR